MKKIIATLIPIVLIILILAWTFYQEKYTYSTEMADLDEYFQLMEMDKVAITLGNELLVEQALFYDEIYYLDIDTVKEYLNDRFYVDDNESLLLYSTDIDTYCVLLGESYYGYGEETVEVGYEITTVQRDILYVALDYVKKVTNFSYMVYEEPMRMQIHTEWETYEVATIQEDSAVRNLGGIKSPILTEVKVGDEVVILDEMGEWSKVKTNDTYVGYIENYQLDNYQKMSLEPVTDYKEPEYTSIHKDYQISMGWHQVTNTTANGNVKDVLNSSKGINVISPTWYYLKDNEGEIEDLSSSAYVDTAHSQGVEVWVLIEDITYKEDFEFNEIMSYTTKRAMLIDTVVSSVLNCGADGINVDFEGVPSDGGEHYIQFIRELSIACRLNELVLSIDNYVPMPHTSHYNRAEQGVVADYVVIMGYDEHWSGSGEAGPGASLGFVQSGIEETLKEVPANKIINGIPFYTSIWATEGSETTNQQVGMGYAQSAIDDNDAEMIWDEELGQYYATYEQDNVLYQIWLEDEESTAARLNLMSGYNLAGVAQWKLGLEISEVWDVIKEYLEN